MKPFFYNENMSSVFEQWSGGSGRKSYSWILSWCGKVCREAVGKEIHSVQVSLQVLLILHNNLYKLLYNSRVSKV